MKTLETDQGPGQGLDPEIQAFLSQSAVAFGPVSSLTNWEQARRGYAALCRAFHSPRPPGLVTHDRHIGALSVRHYLPMGRTTEARILYIHGGGFVLGGIESHDAICADIAAATAREVVALAYRLAPEHPYPAALNDCETLWRGLLCDGGPMLVMGDSAGATLAVGLSLRARRLGLAMPVGLLLIYPALGAAAALDSMRTHATAPGLSMAELDGYAVAYCGARWGEGHDAELWPLQARDLRGLPPIVLFPAEIDPLCDEAALFAEHLQAWAVPATVHLGAGLVHGHLRARHMSERARLVFQEICAAARAF